MNIELVIAERLKLQSTQKKINELMGCTYDISISAIKSLSFMDKLKSFDTQKQKSIIITLGGHANLQKTTNYLNI